MRSRQHLARRAPRRAMRDLPVAARRRMASHGGHAIQYAYLTTTSAGARHTADDLITDVVVDESRNGPTRAGRGSSAYRTCAMAHTLNTL